MTAKAKNKHAKGDETDETDETFQWGIRFWELQATNAAEKQKEREVMMYQEMPWNYKQAKGGNCLFTLYEYC